MSVNYERSPALQDLRVRAFRMGLRSGKRAGDMGGRKAALHRWHTRWNDNVMLIAQLDWEDGFRQGVFEAGMNH